LKKKSSYDLILELYKTNINRKDMMMIHLRFIEEIDEKKKKV
jgi:hypothetical protein